MPSLKQLTCSVEWASNNTPFQEFGTVYGDGVVETLILVPKQPQTFTVHLVSRGFIAEGLAVLVYVDGDYQCNRNRLNLRPTKKDASKKWVEVDFRLRQKEKSIGDGVYLGREWRFDTHNIAYQPVANEAVDHFERLGDIEVFVLRCKARIPSDEEREDSDSGADSRVPDTSMVEDVDAGQDNRTHDSNVQSFAGDHEEIGLTGLGLYDGASDGQGRPQYFGLDGNGYVYGGPQGYQPHNQYEGWPPGYVPLPSWPGPMHYLQHPPSIVPPATSGPLPPLPAWSGPMNYQQNYPNIVSQATSGPPPPPPPPPDQPGQAQEKRVHFDFGPGPGPAPPSHAQSNAGWQRTANWAPQQRMQPTQPLSTPFQPAPTAPYSTFHTNYMTAPVYPIPTQSPWASTVPYQGWPQVPEPYGPAQAPPPFVPNTTYNQPPEYWQGSAYNNTQSQPTQTWNGNQASNTGMPNNPVTQQDNWTVNPSNNAADDGSKNGTATTNDEEKWDDNETGQNDTKFEASGAWDGKETGAVQRQQGTGWEETSTGIHSSQNNTWEPTGNQPSQNQASGNVGWAAAPSAGFQLPKPGPEMMPVIIQEPQANHPRSLYGPYGPYVELKTSAASEAPAEVEEEPRYDVPISVAQRKGSTHQVVPGRGYKYLHRRCTPEYMDSIEEPYARFVFKYRTRDQLQAELGIGIDAEPSADAEVQKLQAMEKQQIIDMLLRAQRALGGKIPSPPPPPARLPGNDGPVLMQTVPVPRPAQPLPEYRLPAPRVGSNPSGPSIPAFSQPPPQYQGPPPNDVGWGSGAGDGQQQPQPQLQPHPLASGNAPAFGVWASGGHPSQQQQQEGDNRGGPASSSAGSSPLGAHDAPVGVGGGEWNASGAAVGSGGAEEAAAPGAGW